MGFLWGGVKGDNSPKAWLQHKVLLSYRIQSGLLGLGACSLKSVFLSADCSRRIESKARAVNRCSLIVELR